MESKIFRLQKTWHYLYNIFVTYFDSEKKVGRKRKRQESDNTPSEVKKTPKDTPKLTRGPQKETPKDTPKTRLGAKDGVSTDAQLIGADFPHLTICNLDKLLCKYFL